MTGVFGATEAGFDQGEARLHEHDEIAGYQRPHKVDAETVLINEQGEIVGERFVRLRRIELLLRNGFAIWRNGGQVALISGI